MATVKGEGGLFPETVHFIVVVLPLARFTAYFLLKSLARTIVEKPSPLSGDEMRFLRKRLGKKSLEFAGMLGCTPENYSKVENAAHEPSKQTDRLVRLIYGFLSGDKKLATDLQKNFGQWFTSLHGTGGGERIVAAHVNSRKNMWVIQAEVQAA